MPKRLDDLRIVDPVLSSIAQGYHNENLIGTNLFPFVPVQNSKGKVPAFGKEAFIVRNTIRAIRSQSNRIPPSDINYIEFETDEHDVEMALDYLEQEEAYNWQKLESRITKELMDILLLGLEKEIADLVQNPNNFSSNLKKEITTANAWDDYTLNNVDPINDILNAKEAIRQIIGIYPNSIIFGQSAYKALINHPKVLQKIEYSGLSKITTEIISQLTEIENIHIGKTVYSNDGITFQDTWQDNVILAYVDKSDNSKRSEYNPSYGYTFRKKNNPFIDTYTENGGKIKVFRATDNYDVKITGSDAAYLIHNTNHL